MKNRFCFAILASMLACSIGLGDDINVSVDGISSFGDGTSTNNDTILVEVGDLTTITAVSWDVTIDAINPSWYSEAAVSIDGAITLRPGIADAFAGDGIPNEYSSGGYIVFGAIPLPDIVLDDSNSDGSNDFLLTFFETFDDDDDLTADAIWGNGTAGTNASGIGGLEFNVVPEPASVGLVALLTMGALLRRRK